MRLNATERLRDMRNYYTVATSLKHLALVPEVQDTLEVWGANYKPNHGVLIGGLALSFYRTPWATQDVDILLLHESDIPVAVDGFKRVRPHTFRENGTHVEVELVTPSLIDLPTAVASKVFNTAVTHDGIRVASLEGMIALKLYGSNSLRRELGDLADIVAMLERLDTFPSMSDWHLSATQLAKYEDAKRRSL
jgi:hypothetical protein